jgi:hypothetical protein
MAEGNNESMPLWFLGKISEVKRVHFGFIKLDLLPQNGNMVIRFLQNEKLSPRTETGLDYPNRDPEKFAE